MKLMNNFRKNLLKVVFLLALGSPAHPADLNSVLSTYGGWPLCDQGWPEYCGGPIEYILLIEGHGGGSYKLTVQLKSGEINEYSGIVPTGYVWAPVLIITVDSEVMSSTVVVTGGDSIRKEARRG